MPVPNAYDLLAMTSPCNNASLQQICHVVKTDISSAQAALRELVTGFVEFALILVVIAAVVHIIVKKRKKQMQRSLPWGELHFP